MCMLIHASIFNGHSSEMCMFIVYFVTVKCRK